MTSPRTFAEKQSRHAGLAATVALHVVVLAALLASAPVRRAPAAPPPIMVSLFAPPAVESPTIPSAPRPVKPVAQPPTRRPADPAPLPAIAAQSPTAFDMPAAETAQSAPPIQHASPPAPAAAAQPVVPPNFDAAYLDNPPPSYPPIARRSGEQGRVVLRVHVSAEGVAESVEIRTSSGSPRLDRAALETVKRWRFVPARQGADTVAAWVLVPIHFTLEG